MSDGTQNVTSNTTGTEAPAAQPVLGAPASTETKAPDAVAKPDEKAGAPATPPASEVKPDEKKTDEKPVDDKAKLEADAKAAEAKKAEEAKAAKEAADKAWAEFKPKLPAGAELNEAELKEFIPVARELGLDPEKAQKLIEFDAKREAQRAQASVDKLKTERNGWLQATTKRVGADKVVEATKQANRALEKFAPKGLVQFLQQTGFDGHPGLFELLQNVGAAMKDDSISGAVPGNGVGAPTEEAQLRTLYPTMFPK